MTVADALTDFYEKRNDAGHAFIPLFHECVRLTELPPAMAFLFTAQLFEVEFELFAVRTAGSAQSRHAGRFGLRFDSPELN